MESRRSLHWTIALLSFVCASDALDSAVNGGIYPWFVYALMTFIFLAAMVWHGIAAEREKNVTECPAA